MFRALTIIFAVCLAVSAVEMPPNPISKPGYVLTFDDEFDGPTLDTINKWVPEHLRGTSCAGRAQYTFQNGCIILTRGGIQTYAAYNMHTSGDYCTAYQIPTQDKFKQLYGYYESRQKICQTCHHVAWWCVECTQQGDELDIHEHEGYGGPNFNDWRGPNGWPNSQTVYKTYDDITTAAQRRSEFHIYAFEVYDAGVKIYYDNILLQDDKVDWKGRGEVPLMHILSGYYGAYDFTIDYFRAYVKGATVLRNQPMVTSRSIAHSTTGNANLNIFDIRGALVARQSVSGPARFESSALFSPGKHLVRINQTGQVKTSGIVVVQ